MLTMLGGACSRSETQTKGVDGSPKPGLLIAPFDDKTALQFQQQWAGYSGTQPEFANTIGMKLVLIPAGVFTMGGRSSGTNQTNVSPPHKVTITKGFFLGAYHVTVGQFRLFVQETGYKTEAETDGRGADIWKVTATSAMMQTDLKGNWKNVGFAQTDDHPVVDVSWNDAVAFCQWLAKKEGKTYRLPTEAEWEYCARAGTTTIYPWGDNPDDGKGWANCDDLSREADHPTWEVFKWRDGFEYTSPVGSFRSNAFGLFDMIGNAWQWCGDWGAKNYYGRDQIDPKGPDTGVDRVLRGGSWCDGPTGCQISFRIRSIPPDRGNFIGFRVVLELTNSK